MLMEYRLDATTDKITVGKREKTDSGMNENKIQLPAHLISLIYIPHMMS
jgi:hypothetical protein